MDGGGQIEVRKGPLSIACGLFNKAADDYKFEIAFFQE